MWLLMLTVKKRADWIPVDRIFQKCGKCGFIDIRFLRKNEYQ